MDNDRGRRGRQEETRRDHEGDKRSIPCSRCVHRTQKPLARRLQARRKNTYVKTKVDTFPESIVVLLTLVQTYEESTSNKPRALTNSKHPDIVMVKAGNKRYTGRGPDTTKSGDNMTGIRNKAGREGCDICGAKNHWKATCPHEHASDEELKNIRARNAASPQLLEVGSTEQEVGGEGRHKGEDIWEDMEGVARIQ